MTSTRENIGRTGGDVQTPEHPEDPEDLAALEELPERMAIPEGQGPGCATTGYFDDTPNESATAPAPTSGGEC